MQTDGITILGFIPNGMRGITVNSDSLRSPQIN